MHLREGRGGDGFAVERRETLRVSRGDVPGDDGGVHGDVPGDEIRHRARAQLGDDDVANVLPVERPGGILQLRELLLKRDGHAAGGGYELTSLGVQTAVALAQGEKPRGGALVNAVSRLLEGGRVLLEPAERPLVIRDDERGGGGGGRRARHADAPALVRGVPVRKTGAASERGDGGGRAASQRARHVVGCLTN